MTLLFAADSEVPSGGAFRELVAARAAEKTDGGCSPRK